ncbi:retrovirus-related pol polyprotein from transposon TNT 1-94 [Tanacetum coccineum]
MSAKTAGLVCGSSDNSDQCKKLKKALYGLKQAPRAWYQSVVKVSTFLGILLKGNRGFTIIHKRQGKYLSPGSKSTFHKSIELLYKPLNIALESLEKKYGMESSDLVDTSMVEKSKLDERYTRGKP